MSKVSNIRYAQKFSVKRYLILVVFYAGGKRKRLKDIVNNTSYKFPLHVEFEKKRRWTFRIGSQKYSSTNFGYLTLEREHWQTFLKGNTINNGLYSIHYHPRSALKLKSDAACHVSMCIKVPP